MRITEDEEGNIKYSKIEIKSEVVEEEKKLLEIAKERIKRIKEKFGLKDAR